MTMKRRIGILIAGHIPEELSGRFGHYGTMFSEFLGPESFDYASYFVVDGHVPDDPDKADGWLITGSRYGVYEDHPWIRRLEEFVRAIRDAGKPLVGVCFGHQVIAKALGGTVEKFALGWTAGATRYTGMNGAGDLTLLAWHQDQVIVPPAEARISATSPFCAHAALSYGDWAISFQAHPEFSSSYFSALVEARRTLVGENVACLALADTENTSSPQVAKLIADHFRRAWKRQGTIQAMISDQNHSNREAIMPVYPNASLHIGGQWRPGSGLALDVVNPATGEVIGKVESAATTDLDDALAAASSGFTVWRHTSPMERAGIMKKAAGLLAERIEKIAPLLTMEQGKPLQQARNEISSAVEIIHWFAEETTRTYGRLIPARALDVAQDVVREPVGPVAAFTPWNFPINQSVLKLAAALAAGCSIIMKGPEETPASCAELVKAFVDAGMPDGVVNLVYGVPSFISTYLISHPVIRKVSFTGSTPVGKVLAQLAGQHLKPITLELGGHAPALVFDDADIGDAARVLARAKYYNAGQVCIAPTRLLVHRAVFDRFVAAFESEVKAIKTGYGLDPDVTMGPLANERRLVAMQEFVDDAAEHSAEILSGGHRIGTCGNFFAPTLVLGAPTQSRVQRDEPFGPVALINRVDDYAQAVAEANRLPYGLAAYAFTRSARTMNDLARDIEAGMLSINHHGLALPETPFGGVKESGYGTEGGSEGIDAYLTPKFVSKRFI